MKKKLLVVLMLFIYIFTIIPIKVNASSTTDLSFDELTSSKVSEKNNEKVGEYDIKISVPGNEKTVISGYNFLFVLDASTSTNYTKWNSMRQAVIDTVKILLPNEDNSLNVNKVGLMTFGINSHLNIPLTSDSTLFNALPENAGQSLLLPGRSATNNEVGLKGAYNYLASLSDEVKKAPNRTYVIYLTDGESNMNEKKYDFYQVGQNSYLSFMQTEVMRSLLYFYSNSEVNRAAVISETIDKINNVDENLLINYVLEMEKLKEELDQNTTLTDREKSQKYSEKENAIIKELLLNENVNKITLDYIDTIFNLIGYDKTKTYSASEYESLVNAYKFSDDLNYQQLAEDFLYYPIFVVGGNKLENANRAVEAGNLLKTLSTVYTIAYNTKGGLTRDDAKKIMDPNYAGNEKAGYTPNTPETHFSSGYYFTDIKEIVNIFSNLTADLIYTNYVNSIITDYTSKWVIPMDVNGDNIFDEKDITLTNDGVLVPDANIEVIKLTEEEIQNSADEQIKGNTNGDIYKITWYLKDKFKHSDKYELSYKVKVDTQEEGFVSEELYKANGETTLTYDVIETGPNGETTIAEDVIFNIDVPTVSQKENVIVVTKKDEENNLLKGSDFNLISEDGLNQVKKEYSVDGQNWTSENNDNKATYFKFSGLYDYNYEIKETIIPENYEENTSNIIHDLTNLEGQIKNNEVVNNHKKGTVKVYYVIKIDDTYIPLNEYGKDEFGNVTDDFIGIELEDEIMTHKVGETFTTTYREINEYELVGLYEGIVITDENKLEGNSVSDKFTTTIKEYTYVYTPLGIGDGELDDDNIDNDQELPLPPQTGFEVNYTFFNRVLTSSIMFLSVIFLTKLKRKED